METEAYKTLNNKYQKLASEYAKVRSQVGVLKKAIVDEQEKRLEWESKAQVTDQKVRKLEQELDSVTFRNRQLEKRIEILQSDSTVQPISVVEPNLIIHVEQNKRLQEELSRTQERYEQEVTKLKRAIENDFVSKELLVTLEESCNERVNVLNMKLMTMNSQNVRLNEKLNSFEVVKTPHDGSLHEKQRQCEISRENLATENQILRLKLKKLTSDDTVVEKQDQDVIEFLRSRIESLIKDLQVSDSKATHYYHEAFNLCRIVHTSNLTNKRVCNEFEKLKDHVVAKEHEHAVFQTALNSQVNSLTEHIGCLNDKIATQADMIIQLKK